MGIRFPVRRRSRSDHANVEWQRSASQDAEENLVANVAVSRETAVVATQFGIGELVRHRLLPFRGVIFDVDPEFSQSEEWWDSIPETMRPAKDQPFYHLLAENQDATYIAYVSQQNLIHDESGIPIGHPAIGEVFSGFHDGRYELRREHAH